MEPPRGTSQEAATRHDNFTPQHDEQHERRLSSATTTTTTTKLIPTTTAFSLSNATIHQQLSFLENPQHVPSILEFNFQHGASNTTTTTTRNMPPPISSGTTTVAFQLLPPISNHVNDREWNRRQQVSQQHECSLQQPAFAMNASHMVQQQHHCHLHASSLHTYTQPHVISSTNSFTPSSSPLPQHQQHRDAFMNTTNNDNDGISNSLKKDLPSYLEPQISFGSDPQDCLSSIFDTNNSGVKWLARGVKENYCSLTTKEGTSSLSTYLAGNHQCHITHTCSWSSPLSYSSHHQQQQQQQNHHLFPLTPLPSSYTPHQMHAIVGSHNSETSPNITYIPQDITTEQSNSSISSSISANHAFPSSSKVMHLANASLSTTCHTNSASTIVPTISSTFSESNMHASNISPLSTKSLLTLQQQPPSPHAFNMIHASMNIPPQNPSSSQSPPPQIGSGVASMHASKISKKRSSSRAYGKRNSNASLILQPSSLITISSSNVTSSLADSVGGGKGTSSSSCGALMIIGEEYTALQDSDLDEVLDEDEDHEEKPSMHTGGGGEYQDEYGKTTNIMTSMHDEQLEDGNTSKSTTGKNASVMKRPSFTKIITSESERAQINHGTWSKEEHELFIKGLREVGRNWELIATKYIKSRARSQVASHGMLFSHDV